MAQTWSRKPVCRCRSKEAVFCVRFSPDDKVVACGMFDGTVVGYDPHSGTNKFEFNVAPREERETLPVTALAFKPAAPRPILLIGCSNGTVERWDLRTLEKVSTIKEDGNEIYAVDYRSDGTLFATCGHDAVVRVYDDATGECIRVFHTVTEHPNNPAAVRLYSVRFSPQDPNLLIACGWGNVIHQFDLREGAETEKRKDLFGAYMTGDSLDIRGNTILSASHRLDNRLQLWNSESGSVEEMKWPSLNDFMPQCAKLSNDADGDLIACGGGGDNMKKAAFVFDRKNGKMVVDALFDSAINACDFARREAMVAFGDGDGHLHVFEKLNKK